jgi:transposase-like protein
MDIIKYSAEVISVKDQIIIHLTKELHKLKPFEYEPNPEEPVSLDYQKMVIDTPPIFEYYDKLDYKILLKNHLHTKGKPLKPVSRRADSTPICKSISCPQCSAPSDYLYDNNGGRGQYRCRVCGCIFHENNRFLKQVAIKCPHCQIKLDKIKKRDDFDIFKCRNKKCPDYLRKLKSMTKDEKKLYKEHPEEFKLHYIYRSFTIDFVPLSKDQPDKPKVDLSKIHSSEYTLGLVLTYFVNYGMSARATSAVMKDVHNIKISRQTVLNYSTALKPLLDYFNKNFPYELSGQYCGDETYVRIKGKWHYLCFFFDAVKKIFLAYPISKNRDTKLAIEAIDDLLSKLPEVPNQPEDSDKLKLIVDGNPIYLLAQQFFAENRIHFDVKQVIGLTNKDATSKEYRPLKNVIERVNRAYKTNIRHFFGFGSMNGAESFTTLFVSFFNFLRPHSALDGNVPVIIDGLVDAQDMPARWIKLIKTAQNFALTGQVA